MNTQFAVATQIMTYLAVKGDCSVSSDDMACRIQTHPVVVRRLIGILRKAELVETQLGAGGGARLARLPEFISLREVYEAIEKQDSDLFALGQLKGNPEGITLFIVNALEEVLGDAEEKLKEQLAGVSVLELVTRVKLRLATEGHTACPEHGPTPQMSEINAGL